MDATRNREDTLRTAEKAWEWLDRLTEATPEEKTQFSAWLAESARNIEEFLLASAIHREFEGIDTAKHIDIDKLVEETRKNVIALEIDKAAPFTSVAPTKQRPRWQRPAAWAAAIATIAVIASFSVNLASWRGYSTDIGEQRTLELADGSVVQLNTQSRVKVDYGAEARTIQLISGEALFKVARDPSRPFRVQVGNTSIQAVGTQFNVQRGEHTTAVTVLEGAVKISQLNNLLTAGQSATITTNGKVVQRMAAVDTEKVNAWRQRRLIFRGDALSDVAAEFNRYNRSPRIRVDGETANHKKLNGVFDADNPELLVFFLRSDPELLVERTADEVIIRSR